MTMVFPAAQAFARPIWSSLRALHSDCLRLRRDEPALRAGAADCEVAADPDAGWVRLALRAPAAPSLLAVFNFAGAQDVPLPGGPARELLLSTDAARYGGSGGQCRLAADGVAAPPWGALLLREHAR